MYSTDTLTEMPVCVGEGYWSVFQFAKTNALFLIGTCKIFN